MNIRYVIFQIVKSLGFHKGDLIRNNVYLEQLLNYAENYGIKNKNIIEEVDKEMELLCNEGIFTCQRYGEDITNFYLTDKGEEIIYNG